MERTEYKDDEDNVYILVDAPKYEKGDPTCRGCVARADSMVPGGKFCLKLQSLANCHVPFNKQVFQQVKWGAYRD